MNITTSKLGRGLGSLIAAGGPEYSASLSNTDESNLVAPGPSPVEASEHSTSAKTNEDTSSNHLQDLPINLIVPNPHQPRKVIDPESIQELASSIKVEGLLQPIVVRSVENGYELIAGERRWRAHQHLGRSTILARVLDASDLSSASLSLIENLQREELNPLEEALGYQSLISDFNLTQEDVSRRMGKSRSHISNLMRLLQLDGELRRLLADGELSVGHAKVLLGVEDQEIRLSIARKAVLEGWTVRQTEEALLGWIKKIGTQKTRNASNNQFEELANKTSRATGRKVKIKATRSGKGTVSFSFKDEKDLSSFLSQFQS